jgi:hypothetical protein
MNKLQQFIQSKPCGFLRDTDMPALIALDRLFPVLVRCGGCRFTCGAQDFEHLERCLVAGGDYVRDVSFPVGSMERAVAWVPEPTFEERKELFRLAKNATSAGDVATVRAIRDSLEQFDESRCGGVFDGSRVTSDADSGL